MGVKHVHVIVLAVVTSSLQWNVHRCGTTPYLGSNPESEAMDPREGQKDTDRRVSRLTELRWKMPVLVCCSRSACGGLELSRRRALVSRLTELRWKVPVLSAVQPCVVAVEGRRSRTSWVPCPRSALPRNDTLYEGG